MASRVVVSTNLTPNLLMHIFSCLEVEGSFYDSKYGMKHHFTLEEEDYKNWIEHSRKCLTLGCNAELYAVLFQIPSYIPADDIEMILECFDNISEAIRQGKIDILIESYPELFSNLPIYAPIELFQNHFKKLNEHQEIILDIISIFKGVLKGVWDRFYAEYWEETVKPNLEEKAKELNVILEPINIINAWEKLLNFTFPYSEFVALLVEPTNTIATNLLAEKIVISSKREENENYRILVHEIGRSFLLNMKLYESAKLKVIAESNIDKLTQIVDAACVILKNKLNKKLRMRDDEPDPYASSISFDYKQTFQKIWEEMDEKDIFEAILKTYNKLSPVS